MACGDSRSFFWGNRMSQKLFFLVVLQTMLLAGGCGNASGQPVSQATPQKTSHAMEQHMRLASGSTPAAASRQAPKFDISPAEAAKLVDGNKAFLVDVREKDEILTDGMAKPAKWLSMEEIQTRGNRYEDAIRTWPKSTQLIFYCVSGRRAKIAADHFKELGYTTLNMGRFKDWQDAGLPVRAKP